MFGLSAEHLIVIGIIVLLFGARRLPELGGAIGQTIRNFKKSMEVAELDQPPADSKRKVAGGSADAGEKPPGTDGAGSA